MYCIHILEAFLCTHWDQLRNVGLERNGDDVEGVGVGPGVGLGTELDVFLGHTGLHLTCQHIVQLSQSRMQLGCTK